jgi:hypothetical protein
MGVIHCLAFITINKKYNEGKVSGKKKLWPNHFDDKFILYPRECQKDNDSMINDRLWFPISNIFQEDTCGRWFNNGPLHLHPLVLLLLLDQGLLLLLLGFTCARGGRGTHGVC